MNQFRPLPIYELLGQPRSMTPEGFNELAHFVAMPTDGYDDLMVRIAYPEDSVVTVHAMPAATSDEPRLVFLDRDGHRELADDHAAIAGHLTIVEAMRSLQRHGNQPPRDGFLDRQEFVALVETFLGDAESYSDPVLGIRRNHNGLALEVELKPMPWLSPYLQSGNPITMVDHDGKVVRNHGHHAYATAYLRDLIAAREADLAATAPGCTA